MFGLLFRFVFFLIFLGLPFMALIRGSIYVHEKYAMGAYPSLLIGAGATIMVLIVYMTLAYSRFTDRVGNLGAFKSRALFAGVVLLGFCIHGLFFMSNRNMKNAEVANEIRELHPISRIALSTVIFVDKDLIITDASRLPEDYSQMGLPSKSRSLHYKQRDGYSYAFDLRTNRRSEFRNLVLQNYFRLMGFQTMRHGGTADHLHVSLKCHYLPGSI